MEEAPEEAQLVMAQPRVIQLDGGQCARKPMKPE